MQLTLLCKDFNSFRFCCACLFPVLAMMRARLHRDSQQQKLWHCYGVMCALIAALPDGTDEDLLMSHGRVIRP
jgi:hypothetical protein